MSKFEFDGDTLLLYGRWDYKANKSDLKRLKSLIMNELNTTNIIQKEIGII